MKTIIRYIVASFALGVLMPATASEGAEKTRISIADGQWRLNGGLTYSGTPAQGLLMNVRMVNAVFEDKHGASWGFMHEKINQHFPFHFKGSEDDPPVYAGLKQLTTLSSDRDDAAEEKNYFVRYKRSAISSWSCSETRFAFPLLLTWGRVDRFASLGFSVSAKYCPGGRDRLIASALAPHGFKSYTRSSTKYKR